MRCENNTDNIFHRRDYTVIVSVLLCIAHPVIGFIYEHDWNFLFGPILLFCGLLLPIMFYLKYAPILLSVFFFIYASDIALEYAVGGEIDLLWHMFGILIWGSLTFIVDYRWAKHSWSN